MIELAADRLAAAAGATIARAGAPGHPRRATVDTRDTGRGDLFFGLRGARDDGGAHAGGALAAGAWGVVVEPRRAERLAAEAGEGWVLASESPLDSLQALARAWRRELDCRVVGITGSVGKTSVKDVARAILPFRVHASPENYNTEIGLPLAILAAPSGSEVLVLEMAMRGIGQIAELCAIAEPDVAAITNIGPVHLELLGTREAIAEAKAEILAGLGAEGRAVIPADEEALEPHLHDRLETVTFGPGGDVFASRTQRRDGGIEATIVTPVGEAPFRFAFDEAHNLSNAECAVAIGVALAAPVAEMARRAPRISFSRLRGERVELPGGSVLFNDCYNANPVSLRAALEHLVAADVGGRTIAVLGGMAELGPEGPAYHREVGELARRLGVDLVVGVGDLARDYGPDEWAPDPAAAAAAAEPLIGSADAVLVKGSRSVGLEAFTEALLARMRERG